MGSIRKRNGSNLLFFDFRYLNVRCRELSALTDTAANRKNMEKMLAKIESEINANTFDGLADSMTQSPVENWQAGNFPGRICRELYSNDPSAC